jgi:hypothetical protein
MLSPELNQHLIKKGYVQHQLLSASEVQYLLDEICNIYPADKFLSKDDTSTKQGITTSYLDSDIALRDRIFNIVQKTLSPHIEALLDDYRILACGLFVKAPNGGWLDLHYHPTVVEDLKHWVINIWCPLQETDFSNGTFCAVPESHRIFPMIIDCSPQEPPFYHSYAEDIRNHYSVAIPAKAGEAVLFEDSLLHWSPQNTSDSPRYAIHCTCIPREASSVCIYPKEGDAEYLEMYEVSDRFYIERTHIQQRENLKLREVLPNRNQSYTFEEFKRRMENSSTIRKTMSF